LSIRYRYRYGRIDSVSTISMPGSCLSQWPWGIPVPYPPRCETCPQVRDQTIKLNWAPRYNQAIQQTFEKWSHRDLILINRLPVAGWNVLFKCRHWLYRYQCSGSAGSDPLVFWPPGSGSVNLLHVSGFVSSSGSWSYLLIKVP
jgi:hypothetical protein